MGAPQLQPQPDELDVLRPFAREEWVVSMRPGAWVALRKGQPRKLLTIPEAICIRKVIDPQADGAKKAETIVAREIHYARFPSGDWFVFEAVPKDGTHEFHGLVLDREFGDEIYSELYQKLQLRKGKTYVEYLERLKKARGRH